MSNMKHAIVATTTDLTFKLDYLDQQRDDIWKLKFKDFEDLARAIDGYDDQYEEANELLSKLVSLFTKHYMDQGMDEYEADSKAHDELKDLDERVSYHFDQVVYFRQQKI